MFRVGSQFKLEKKSVMAFLLSALVLLGNLLAVAPQLHERLHCDSKSSQHHCAVTLYEQGQLDSATLDVLPDQSLGLIGDQLQFVLVRFAPAIENLPAGRAPPVSSSNS